MTSIPLSGTQHTLRSGEYEATIASIGASLRRLTHAGRELILSFAADEVRPSFRGATLAPWPNRVAAGTYDFAGDTYVLPIADAGRPNALHGLASWLDFAVVAESDDSVTLVATVVPQAGYPWRVRVETTFALGADGLTQTVVATNESGESAPFGTGPHPYLVAGPSALDTWTFALDAAQVLEVTPDTLQPVALVDVAGSARFDWRSPRVIGDAAVDHAFTGIGSAVARVTDPTGTGVEMTWDAACSWVQVYTCDQPGGSANPVHRTGLAVEPMTCAPDAFNDDNYPYDTGLQVLAPGAKSMASWRIAAL
ncbi:aldose 1-epimerase family protein [uncultured Microbacterium sp.]|uniref:aldose 1-epimerase family protein n=1 Tax=uncultured Microbacterium sp. TaxID=191216 RepID=UPI0026025788|nr:aldose 1-epimerase family protein [uncultured Microbacterium sp.]